VPLTEHERQLILDFVDSNMLPEFCLAVWLVGSRAKGMARHDSDWDVVAVCEQVTARIAEANYTGYAAPGMKVELVFAHPDHLNDQGRYMTDLRAHGIRLR
jgi:hypothetical protein